MLDAPALYMRRTVGGTLYAIEPIDGATIKRVLDDHGRRCRHGLSAGAEGHTGGRLHARRADLPAAQSSHAKIYGYSPVEQIVMTVNIALRRALHQLQFY